MTITYIAQIFDNTPPLQAARRTHRQYTLNVTSPAFALRTEAALSPQYPLANNSFGKVVGRLYSLILHKRPQILLVFKDVTALAAQLAVKVRTGWGWKGTAQSGKDVFRTSWSKVGHRSYWNHIDLF